MENTSADPGTGDFLWILQNIRVTASNSQYNFWAFTEIFHISVYTYAGKGKKIFDEKPKFCFSKFVSAMANVSLNREAAAVKEIGGWLFLK